jgi:hypothetical protein
VGFFRGTIFLFVMRIFSERAAAEFSASFFKLLLCVDLFLMTKT